MGSWPAGLLLLMKPSRIALLQLCAVDSAGAPRVAGARASISSTWYVRWRLHPHQKSPARIARADSASHLPTALYSWSCPDPVVTRPLTCHLTVLLTAVLLVAVPLTAHPAAAPQAVRFRPAVSSSSSASPPLRAAPSAWLHSCRPRLSRHIAGLLRRRGPGRERAWRGAGRGRLLAAVAERQDEVRHLGLQLRRLVFEKVPPASVVLHVESVHFGVQICGSNRGLRHSTEVQMSSLCRIRKMSVATKCTISWRVGMEAKMQQ